MTTVDDLQEQYESTPGTAYEVRQPLHSKRPGDRVTLTDAERQAYDDDELREIGEEELKAIWQDVADEQNSPAKTHLVAFQSAVGSYRQGDQTWVTAERYSELADKGLVTKVKVQLPDDDEQSDREKLRRDVRLTKVKQLSYQDLRSVASTISDELDEATPGRKKEVLQDYVVEEYQTLARLHDEGEVDVEFDV